MIVGCVHFDNSNMISFKVSTGKAPRWCQKSPRKSTPLFSLAATSWTYFSVCKHTSLVFRDTCKSENTTHLSIVSCFIVGTLGDDFDETTSTPLVLVRGELVFALLLFFFFTFAVARTILSLKKRPSLADDDDDANVAKLLPPFLLSARNLSVVIVVRFLLLLLFKISFERNDDDVFGALLLLVVVADIAKRR